MEAVRARQTVQAKAAAAWRLLMAVWCPFPRHHMQRYMGFLDPLTDSPTLPPPIAPSQLSLISSEEIHLPVVTLEVRVSQWRAEGPGGVTCHLKHSLGGLSNPNFPEPAS